MKLKSILSIIKRGAGVITGASAVSAVSVYAFDEIIGVISGLTAFISAITVGVAHIIEVWAKATGRIPLDADIDGK